jgi:hypothetical protein
VRSGASIASSNRPTTKRLSTEPGPTYDRGDGGLSGKGRQAESDLDVDYIDRRAGTCDRDDKAVRPAAMIRGAHCELTWPLGFAAPHVVF